MPNLVYSYVYVPNSTKNRPFRVSSPVFVAIVYEQDENGSVEINGGGGFFLFAKRFFIKISKGRVVTTRNYTIVLVVDLLWKYLNIHRDRKFRWAGCMYGRQQSDTWNDIIVVIKTIIVAVRFSVWLFFTAAACCWVDVHVRRTVSEREPSRFIRTAARLPRPRRLALLAAAWRIII